MTGSFEPHVGVTSGLAEEVPATGFDRFGRQTLETFASLALSSVAGGIYIVVVARWLGPSGLGVLSVLLLLSATGTLILADALSLANIYLGAMRPSTRGALLTNSLIVSGVGGIALGALALMIFALAGLHFGATYLELALIAASLPLTAAGKLVTVLVLATGRSRPYNVLSLGGQLLMPAFTAIAFALSYTSVLAVVIAYLGATAVVLAAALLVVQMPLGSPSLALLVESMKYGLRGSVGNIFQFLNYRLDFFLVSALRGTATVGVYSVAVGLAELLWKIPSAASTILFPRVAAGSPGGVAFTARVSRISLTVTAAAAAALTLVGYPLIHLLFGHMFSGAFVPMVLLMPGVVALSISNILASDLAGRGRPGYSSYAAGLTLGLTIGLDVLLIPKWGASGAAIASTAAYSASALFLLVTFSRLFGIAISDLVIVRRDDIGALPRPRRARATAKP